jgi:hypothetical protein
MQGAAHDGFAGKLFLAGGWWSQALGVGQGHSGQSPSTRRKDRILARGWIKFDPRPVSSTNFTQELCSGPDFLELPAAFMAGTHSAGASRLAFFRVVLCL